MAIDLTDRASNASSRRDARQILTATCIGAVYFLVVAAVLPGGGWDWAGQHLADALGIGGFLGVISIIFGELWDDQGYWRLTTVGSGMALLVAAVEIGADSRSELVIAVGITALLPTIGSALALWNRASIVGFLYSFVFLACAYAVPVIALPEAFHQKWVRLGITLTIIVLIGCVTYAGRPRRLRGAWQTLRSAGLIPAASRNEVAATSPH
ncbi:MAG: hypothetical protein ABSA40_11015 [Candidatus Dormibacteria bacterium]|jgi:hypothetical protein